MTGGHRSSQFLGDQKTWFSWLQAADDGPRTGQVPYILMQQLLVLTTDAWNGQKSYTHMLHVWNNYQHLPQKTPTSKCR